MSRFKLGIVTPEFPPEVGGMQAVALGLARSLNAHCDVSVLTKTSHGLANEPYAIHSTLSGSIDKDVSVLCKHDVDAWLLLNSGYLAIAPELTAPSFGYCHGNDFLRPWCVRSKFVALAPRIRSLPLGRILVGGARRILIRRDLRRGARSVRMAFANSSGTASRMVAALRIPRHKIEVIYPGVDDDFFQNREERKSNTFELLTVSRLDLGSRRKNIDSTLRAIALIQDIPLRFSIVGDGNDRARLETLARELKIESKVRFVGGVDRAQLLQIYRNSDLFILVPQESRRDVEGFGIVYVEAAASGLPVLGSKRRSKTDAIQEGVTGDLLPSGEPPAIATAIRNMWKSRERFPQEQLHEFAEGFRWRNIGQQLYGHMISVLGTESEQDVINRERLCD